MDKPIAAAVLHMDIKSCGLCGRRLLCTNWDMLHDVYCATTADGSKSCYEIAVDKWRDNKAKEATGDAG